MVVDLEKVRFAVEYVTRVANDFSSTNMFFVKNCSLLLRERPPWPANEGWSVSTQERMDSLCSYSAISFETEELLFRCRDPVSAYPLIRLTRNYYFQCVSTPKGWAARVNTEAFSGPPEAFSGPLQFLEFLLDSLVRLVLIIRMFDNGFVSFPDSPLFEIVMQVEIYDLTSSELVKRGVKREWLIGETLALEAGSGHKQPNIHRTKYKGVRRRPDRSRTKPWTAEVKPPTEKNKVWIDDCNTPEAAALAYDVAAFYYGKGNKALNFEHTPRFLPKTLEYSCEKEKKHAIQEQARHLRRNPLFYLIHHLPYDLLICFVMWELQSFYRQLRTTLVLLVVELMRLVRKDSSVIPFPKCWVSSQEEIAHLHAHTNIPQLLESIDCLLEKMLLQEQGYDYTLYQGFESLFKFTAFNNPQLEPREANRVIPLTLQFIEWVRINLVTPQTTSMEAKHLPASPSQCNVRSIMSVEIDLRAPQTSSMAMEAEDPLANIPPQCNALSMHYPHEQIQDTLEQDLIILHKFSLESQHLTYQDATPEEQVVQSPIAGQAATIVLSTPVAAIAETSLLPFPPLDVGIPNEGWGTGDQTGDLYKDIQEGSMSGQLKSTSGTLSNFHRLPFSCFSPVSTGAQTQSTTFMDSDVRKDVMMPIPSSMEVGDCHPKCNNLVVPLPPSHDYTQDALKQDLRNLDELPLEFEHLAFQVTNPEEDEWIKSPTDQAATEFMDLDDGEDLATLLERLQHDQLGDIGDWVAFVEANSNGRLQS